jgi:hypothetical protein
VAVAPEGPACAAGSLQTPPTPAGRTQEAPPSAPSFLARAPGACAFVLRSPQLPALGSAHVLVRVVPNRAAILAGKGLWLTFPDWLATPDAQLLQTAIGDGVTHLYLEVATSSDGFYGGRALDDLLRKAHADGIAVVAWVYASLAHPAADQRLTAAVARYTTPTGDLADGLALDVEDHLVPGVVAGYAAAAHHALGPGGLLVGITWAPQQKPDYPYRSLAPYVQAMAPMDYWHVLPTGYTYAGVYAWVRDSVLTLRRAAGRPRLPVDVATETFDWFSPSGSGLFSPTAAELRAALRGAAAAGALGVSFYRPSTATPQERAVIAEPYPPGG